MKTQPQRSADLTLLSALIKHASVGMMTYLDGEGALVSQPVTPLEMLRDGSLWFIVDTQISKPEYLNVVNLGFANPARGLYVSVSGYGGIEQDSRQIRSLLNGSTGRWVAPGDSGTSLAALKVIPDTAQYWDAPSSRMVHLFALAGSELADDDVPAVDPVWIDAPVRSAAARR